MAVFRAVNPPTSDASDSHATGSPRTAENHARAMKLLESKSGPDFDRAYLDHEIAFHQAVIDAVTKTLLPAIRNAELKTLVESVAPAFVSHRDMAIAMKKQLGY